MPFKLTREMVMVLGGKHAPLYRETFSELCVAAMRAARAHGQALLSLCEMTAYRSALPCFAAGGASPVQLLALTLTLTLTPALALTLTLSLVSSCGSGLFTICRPKLALTGVGQPYP